MNVRLDDLVLAQRLHQQRRGLVDALADEQRLVLAAARGHAGAGLARGDDALLVVDALDGVLAAQARLGALALDVRAVRLQVQVYCLSHCCLVWLRRARGEPGPLRGPGADGARCHTQPSLYALTGERGLTPCRACRRATA